MIRALAAHLAGTLVGGVTLYALLATAEPPPPPLLVQRVFVARPSSPTVARADFPLCFRIVPPPLPGPHPTPTTPYPRRFDKA